MKENKTPSVTNLIGIILIVVALVSAGGLYYLASEYTKISETLVSTSSEITAIRITQNNNTGDVSITVSISVDNPSDLDIELYRIEYLTYLDRYASNQVGNDKYVGSGSTSEGNKTVQAGSSREFQVSFTISSTSPYMSKFVYASDGGNTVFAFINGYIWYNLSDYPDASQKQPVGLSGWVVIQYV
jgi:hypothetical protein